MKQDQLDRILNIVYRTGDRVIIVDKEREEPIVLMDLSGYENLLLPTQPVRGLSEEEMMNRINREIALWRSSNHDNLPTEDAKSETKVEINQDILQPDKLSSTHVQPTVTKNDKQDEIITEETLADIPDDDEKFYFEPIE